jgi:hypothetical protein
MLRNVTPAYESLNPLEILFDGARHSGTYRVMTGSVIVYYGGEVKFASVGMDRPEQVAKWLLIALVRRAVSSKRKQPRD